MKAGIHPKYQAATIICGTCGTEWPTRSTKGGVTKVELCANCHPFYSGEQRIVDTAGQVERFMKRLGQAKDAKKN